MKFLKKMMQVTLAVFFFGLLATSTVFADTTGGQFVDKDNRKYYIKDEQNIKDKSNVEIIYKQEKLYEQ